MFCAWRNNVLNRISHAAEVKKDQGAMMAAVGLYGVYGCLTAIHWLMVCLEYAFSSYQMERIWQAYKEAWPKRSVLQRTGHALFCLMKTVFAPLYWPPCALVNRFISFDIQVPEAIMLRYATSGKIMKQPEARAFVEKHFALGQQEGLSWDDFAKVTKPVAFMLCDAGVRGFLEEQFKVGMPDGLSWSDLLCLVDKKDNRAMEVQKLLRHEHVRSIFAKAIAQGQDRKTVWQRICNIPWGLIWVLEDEGSRDFISEHMDGLSLQDILSISKGAGNVLSSEGGRAVLARLLKQVDGASIFKQCLKLSDTASGVIRSEKAENLLFERLQLGAEDGIAWSVFFALSPVAGSFLADATLHSFLFETLRLGKQDGVDWESFNEMSDDCGSLLSDPTARNFLSNQLHLCQKDGLSWSAFSKATLDIRLVLSDKDAQDFLVQQFNLGQNKDGIDWAHLVDLSTSASRALRDPMLRDFLAKCAMPKDGVSKAWQTFNAISEQALLCMGDSVLCQYFLANKVSLEAICALDLWDLVLLSQKAIRDKYTFSEYMDKKAILIIGEEAKSATGNIYHRQTTHNFKVEESASDSVVGLYHYCKGNVPDISKETIVKMIDALKWADDESPTRQCSNGEVLDKKMVAKNALSRIFNDSYVGKRLFENSADRSQNCQVSLIDTIKMLVGVVAQAKEEGPYPFCKKKDQEGRELDEATLPLAELKRRSVVALIEGLYEAERGGNFDGSHSNDMGGPAYNICIPGHFNKLIQYNVGLLRFCEQKFVSRESIGKKAWEMIEPYFDKVQDKIMWLDDELIQASESFEAFKGVCKDKISNDVKMRLIQEYEKLAPSLLKAYLEQRFNALFDRVFAAWMESNQEACRKIWQAKRQEASENEAENEAEEKWVDQFVQQLKTIRDMGFKKVAILAKSWRLWVKSKTASFDCPSNPTAIRTIMKETQWKPAKSMNAQQALIKLDAFLKDRASENKHVRAIQSEEGLDLDAFKGPGF